MSDSKSCSAVRYEESPDVHVPPADLALANKLAQKKGVDVETYIKALIHDELMKVAKAS